MYNSLIGALAILNDSNFSDLEVADTYRHWSSEIDLLLGGDVYPKIIQNVLRWDPDRSLVVQKIVFGWIVTGKITENNSISSVSSFYNEVALKQQLHKFWELEEVPRKPKLSDENEYYEQLYRSTTFRNNNDRFVVSLFTPSFRY